MAKNGRFDDLFRGKWPFLEIFGTSFLEVIFVNFTIFRNHPQGMGPIFPIFNYFCFDDFSQKMAKNGRFDATFRGKWPFFGIFGTSFLGLVFGHFQEPPPPKKLTLI